MWFSFINSTGTPKAEVNQWQCALYNNCLNLLWGFGETVEAQKLILSKGVFPMIVDALLLQPHSIKEITQKGNYGIVAVTDKMIVDINEGAIGSCSG